MYYLLLLMEIIKKVYLEIQNKLIFHDLFETKI